MSTTRWLKMASVLLVAGATTSGIGLLGGEGGAGAGPQADRKVEAPDAADRPVYAVKRGTLKATVVERGGLESVRNSDAYSQVEGQVTIMTLVPEGTLVKKGQVVCTLDRSTLVDQRINQEITIKGAEAAYENAKLSREVAEIALSEYTKGVFVSEASTLKGEIATARSAVQKAEARLERTRRARKRLSETLAPKGAATTPADLLADLDVDDRLDAIEQTLLREKAAAELAQNKLNLLTQYTRLKTIKSLTAEIVRERSNELAKQANWQLEQSKLKKIEKSLENCKILAPCDGVLTYANDPSRPGGRVSIEEGATIRERQKIFSISDISGPLRVNAKVGESSIDRIRRGLKARIKVDSFPEAELTGEVTEVATLPDPAYVGRASEGKRFTVWVDIDKNSLGIRPGMTATVEIPLKEFDNAITVPRQAVLYVNQNAEVALTKAAGGLARREVIVRVPTVAVRKPKGGFAWREVTLGVSNDQFVEVKRGLVSDEVVILNPAALLSDEEKREKLSPRAGDALERGVFTP